MKKIFLFLTAVCLLTSSFAAFEAKPVSKKATDVFLYIGKDKKISLMQFSVITVKELENLSGKHLNFFERLSFKTEQKKLRKAINKDGTITKNNLINFTNGDGDPSTGFHFGGFALGFFLLIIGVGIAYLLGGDEDVRRNRVKWAWTGFGISVAILGLILKLLAQ